MSNLEQRKAEFKAKAEAARQEKIAEYKRRANCMNLTNAVLTRYSHLVREFFEGVEIDKCVKVNGDWNKKTTTALRDIAQTVLAEYPTWHCHFLTVDNRHGHITMKAESNYKHGDYGCIYYKNSESLEFEPVEHKTDYEYTDYLLAEKELQEAEELEREARSRKSKAKMLLGQ